MYEKIRILRLYGDDSHGSVIHGSPRSEYGSQCSCHFYKGATRDEIKYLHSPQNSKILLLSNPKMECKINLNWTMHIDRNSKMLYQKCSVCNPNAMHVREMNSDYYPTNCIIVYTSLIISEDETTRAIIKLLILRSGSQSLANRNHAWNETRK